MVKSAVDFFAYPSHMDLIYQDLRRVSGLYGLYLSWISYAIWLMLQINAARDS